jgi:hypothetical protein
MTGETKPAEAAKKKIHPLALIGPLVAIFASLFVVFLSSGKKDEPPPAIELGPDQG